jgi:hypothetical protein
MASNSNYFITSNTALASYLLSSGIEYLALNIEHAENERRALFIYEDTTELRTLVTKYNTGKATTNVRAFYDAYKMLVDRVHKAIKEDK